MEIDLVRIPSILALLFFYVIKKTKCEQTGAYIRKLFKPHLPIYFIKMVNIIFLAVIIAVIFVIFFFLKARHVRHRFYVIVFVLFLAFIIISGSNIIKQNNVDLTSFNGLVTAGKVYVKWLGKVVENVKTISGNAIKSDWAG